MQRYKKANDGIHAPEELKQKVLQKASEEAAPKKTSKGTGSSFSLKRWQPVAIAACLVLVLFAGALSLFRHPDLNTAPEGEQFPPQNGSSEMLPGTPLPTSKPQGADTPGSAVLSVAKALNAVTYPAMVQHPHAADYSDDQNGYDAYNADLDAWRDGINAMSSGKDYTAQLSTFLTRTAQTFLAQEDDQNILYSPLNLYTALSMLTETTAGNSRAQLLDLLGCSSVEELRQISKDLWLDNYRADSQTDSVLANSLWLNSSFPAHYVEDTLQILAQDHYASLFEGPAGDPAYDQALQDWINTQTHGLLAEYAKELSMGEDLAMGLASTLYFRANWENVFPKEDTAPDLFHSLSGDETADFMHAKWEMDYTWGTNFSSITLPYQEGKYRMCLMLPDEGTSAQDLLADPDAMAYLLYRGSPASIQTQFGEVVITMPKFDVSSRLELQPGLEQLGVSDIFQWEIADFSPLSDADDLYLSQSLHTVRVVADESQTEAAAFTWMGMAPGAAPPSEDAPIPFILDRPFLFAILGPSNMPLFVGIVAHP